MKTALFIITLLFGSAAFAMSYEVNLSTVNFDGTTMSYSYMTGGGCEDHRSEVVVDVVNDAKFGYTAYVKVLDKTDKPDLCEALIHQQGSVNLRQLVQQKAAAAGMAGNYIRIVLPEISIML